MSHSNARRHHYRNRSRRISRTYLKYAQAPVQQYNGSNFDFRLVIVRHAERMDTTYGSDWYATFFGNSPIASSNLYRNPALPQGLPNVHQHFIIS